MRSEPAARAAADVVRRTLAVPPTLGSGRLVCIDGPAGSGKTTLARAVAARVPTGTSYRVVPMDDLYEGWHGLEAGVVRASADLLAPLAAGHAGGYRRYDWHAEALAEWVPVPPVDVLVLEGVGSGAAAAGLAGVLVWVEADPGRRLLRGLRRDGARQAAAWRSWMQDETEHFARNPTQARATLRLDTSG